MTSLLEWIPDNLDVADLLVRNTSAACQVRTDRKTAQVLHFPSAHPYQEDMAERGTLVALYLASKRGRWSPLTVASQGNILDLFVAFTNTQGREVGDVEPADVEAWLVSLAGLAASTRRTRYSVVNGWFDWLVTHHHATANPCVGVDPPRVPRPAHRALDLDDVARLLNVCEDSRARLVVLLGVQLGLRRAEIAGLEVGDISVGRAMVTVTGKGGHRRSLPFTDEARHALKTYLADRPATAGPLIRGDRYPTRPVQPVWVGRLITRLAFDAGIKHAIYDGVSTHALRHTAASDTYLACRDPLAVRDMLGHASLNTTQVYVRGLDVERLRDAMEGRHYTGAVAALKVVS